MCSWPEKAWGGKDAIETRWWSLVIDRDLDLISDRTMIAVDAGGSVIVGMMTR